VLLCTIYTNNWAHCVLAIDRLIAIVFPNHYSIVVTKPMLGMAIIILWFITTVLDVFPEIAINMQHQQASLSWSGCSPLTTDPRYRAVQLILMRVGVIVV
jgi:Serpentine type 7TM GPCR chemoreceptor Srx